MRPLVHHIKRHRRTAAGRLEGEGNVVGRAARRLLVISEHQRQHLMVFAPFLGDVTARQRRRLVHVIHPGRVVAPLQCGIGCFQRRQALLDQFATLVIRAREDVHPHAQRHLGPLWLVRRPLHFARLRDGNFTDP